MTVVKGAAAGALGALAVGVWLTVVPGLFGMGSFAILWAGLAAPVAAIALGLVARDAEDRAVASWMLRSVVALAAGLAALVAMLSLT